MKTLSILAALVFFSLSCGAQIDEDKALYMRKAEKYRKMKNTGQLLTFGGSAMMVIGLVMISNATSTTTYNSYGQTTTSSGNVGGGLALYLLGGCSVGAGVPLWIVGGINKGRYERKLQQTMTVGINAAPQNRGLVLRYRF
jgi:hypothetical protein